DEDLTFEDEGLVRLRRDLGDVPPVPSPTLHEDEEVAGDEDEEPGFLTRVKRQFFGGLWGSSDADTTHDDEDMGSGVVEGSGAQQRTFRCKLHLLTRWQPAYSNKRSPEYTRSARSIQQAMVTLLNSVPGEKIIQVSDMKQARGSGNILVTVDIMHADETDQKNRMRQLVRGQLERGSLGSSAVNSQFFSFEEPRAPPIPRACPPEKHRCPGGRCAGRCDGINECLDGSDEHNCPAVGVDVGSLVTSLNTETTPVPPEGCRGDAHFTCVGGVTICEVQQCDGNEDCPEGDDEQGCGCEAGSFECDGLRCLTNDRMCDGVQDCADNTDEQNCITQRGLDFFQQHHLPVLVMHLALTCVKMGPHMHAFVIRKLNVQEVKMKMNRSVLKDVNQALYRVTLEPSVSPNPSSVTMWQIVKTELMSKAVLPSPDVNQALYRVTLEPSVSPNPSSVTMWQIVKTELMSKAVLPSLHHLPVLVMHLALTCVKMGPHMHAFVIRKLNVQEVKMKMNRNVLKDVNQALYRVTLEPSVSPNPSSVTMWQIVKTELMSKAVLPSPPLSSLPQPPPPSLASTNPSLASTSPSLASTSPSLPCLNLSLPPLACE
ncbi:hypothetical protein Pcinc_042059, partial [Petrolisthes cinctipes]